MIYENQSQLDADLAFYLKLLRCQDWDVKASIVRSPVMSATVQDGQCVRVASLKTAIIRLLDPADFPDDTSWPQDHEQVLIHEIIHLLDGEVFDEIESADAELASRLHTQRERLVDMCAGAIVTLRRQIPRDPEFAPPKDKWVRGYNGPNPTLTCTCGFSVEGDPGQAGLSEFDKIKREHVCENGKP